MTSSTPPIEREHSPQSCLASKLTNFSIVAIMGPQQAAAPTTVISPQQHHKPPSLAQSRHPRRSPMEPEEDAGAGEPVSTSPQTARVSVRKLRPKNFLCPACKMAFSNNGQLRNHARIHTGERPFSCQYEHCNKTFTRNEELTRHKLIHSGLRPHACNTCGKRFGRKDHLKKHLRTHDNKRIRQMRKRTSFITSTLAQLGHHNQTSIPAGGDRLAGHYRRVPPVDHPAELVLESSPQQQHHLPSVKQQAQEQYLFDPMIFQPSPASTFMNVAPTSNYLSPLAPSLASFATPTSVCSSSTSGSDFMLHQAACLGAAQMAAIEQGPRSSSSSTIQQLANEYWNRWYNLMGLYQTNTGRQYSSQAPPHQVVTTKPIQHYREPQ